MITNPRLEDYIEIISPKNPLFLENIRKIAVKEHIPIIKRDTENLLKVLLFTHMPKTILEVGTAIGYSSLVMSEYSPKDTKILTIEKMEDRVEKANIHIKESGYDKKVALLTGDASTFLKQFLEEGRQFDFIFMDAAKAQYINWLEDMIRLMRRGSVLVSDNCLQGGEILDSVYTIRRRDRTIHARMREYIYTLMNSCELQTTLLPVGDGVCVSVKC